MSDQQIEILELFIEAQDLKQYPEKLGWRTFRPEDPEQARERARVYRKKNKDVVRAREQKRKGTERNLMLRRLRAADPAYKDAARAYRQANRERINANKRESSKRRRERSKAAHAMT